MRRFYKELNTKIGHRIRRTREVVHLTREQLSEMAGISVQFLKDIESGRMGASLETLLKICDSLKVSTDDILKEPPNRNVEHVSHQLTVLLDDVDPELYPFIVEAVREQVRLIQAAQDIAVKKPKKQ